MADAELLELGEQPAENHAWILRAALPFLLLCILAALPLSKVWLRWTAPEDYYSHGPLVPFVTAYLILRKRKELTGLAAPDLGPLYAGAIGAAVLYFVFDSFKWDKTWLFGLLVVAMGFYLIANLRTIKVEPWKPALFLLIPSLVFCTIAGVNEIVSVGWFFVVTSVICLSLYYLGKRKTAIIGLPLLFLFTCVPMPEFLVARTTMPLKQFATNNTVLILRSQMVGIYCEQQGARIEFPGEGDEPPKDVTVGAVCSGLRSLIALIAFGLLFAYITPLSMSKRVLLFLATIPASFVANLIRILTLSLITYKWDANAATGDGLWTWLESTPLSSLVPKFRGITNEPVHDFTGIMIFVVAFIGLFAIERVFTSMELRFGRKKSDFWVLGVIGLLAWHVLTLVAAKMVGGAAGIVIVIASLTPYVLAYIYRRRLQDFYRGMIDPTPEESVNPDATEVANV